MNKKSSIGSKLISSIKHDVKYNKSLFIMTLLPLAVVILFDYVPIYGLQIAFKDYHPLKGIWESEWVGLKYFEKFFSYYKFKDILLNTLLLNLYDVLLSPIPLLFAFCVNYSSANKLSNFVKKVAIMPHFVSIVVVCSLAMRFLSTDGLINNINAMFGAEPVNYLARGEYFRSIYVWSGLWQNLGFDALIYISTFASISKEQHDSAVIEGANLVQRMVYIDLPCILPLFGVNIMFRFGAIMNNNLEKILLLQNNTNMQYSTVISSYSYEAAFSGIIPQYSLAAAIGLFTSVVNVILLVVIRFITRKWEHLDE